MSAELIIVVICGVAIAIFVRTVRRDRRAQFKVMEQISERHREAMVKAADVLTLIMTDQSVEPHQSALSSAMEELADVHPIYMRKFIELAQRTEVFESVVLKSRPTIKRINEFGGHDKVKSGLQEQWGELRTKHRSLYKKHKKEFEAMDDCFPDLSSHD